jgi:hypothetical protein
MVVMARGHSVSGMTGCVAAGAQPGLALRMSAAPSQVRMRTPAAGK